MATLLNAATLKSLMHAERFPALTNDSAPELALLHGWGMPSVVFHEWLPLLRQHAHITLVDLPGFGASSPQPDISAEVLLDQLVAVIPQGAVLAGWSLGGTLATLFLARHPTHCRALVTIATNPRFVASADWPQGMASETFVQFCSNAISAPEQLHRRFLGLQARGVDGERVLLRQLQKLVPEPAPVEAGRWGLKLLEELDSRAALAGCALPGLHIYGEGDVLVPAAVADAVAEIAPAHRVMRLPAGHVPFLSSAEVTAAPIVELLHQLLPLPQRDKRAVARAFSRAAASYDSAAALQRHVAAELRDRLLARKYLPTGGCWLDLGCGSGRETAALVPAARRAGATVVALDLAEGMVHHARAQVTDEGLLWLCGDAEQLPLADGVVSVLYSSLALQWCEQLPKLYREIARVLAPGGRAWISTLGPATLQELREAWREVDGRVHVNRFAGRDSVAQAIAAAGLQVAAWDEQPIVTTYPDVLALSRELRSLGAINVNSGRPVGLGGRARLDGLRASYEPLRRPDGQLPATWQVWLLELVKSHDA
ncbi:MAG: alpha/beta fold hydrolase [Spongiibacteraceae bacterium]|jgi:malonyl-CoA O-methyltransferase|nr:alpha/beta fold hydrolase [Spongiibacteraceae bacterium]